MIGGSVMSLLSTSETKQKIAEEVQNTEDNLQIISAFCKTPAIEFVDQNIKRNITTKKLLVRFLLSDIINDATDFELVEYCKNNGWKLYIRFDLHAKTYIFDRKRCILGSANMTNNGLGLTFHGNYELSGFVDVDQTDLVKIDALFDNAIPMTDELYMKMKSNIEFVSKGSLNCSKLQWDKEIENLFIPQVDTLFTYDFPSTKVPNFNDIESMSFLNCPQILTSIDDVKEAFRWSKAFLWLNNHLSSCPDYTSFFGEIAASLHNSLINDPKPYRKEVKDLLANTLAWIDYLKMDEIRIDIPNYSQRVRKVL